MESSPRLTRASPLFLVLLVAACRGAPTEAPCPEPAAVQANLVARAQPSSFDSTFAAAGAEFHVPAGVLKGVAWVETRWQMVEGHEEFPGLPPAFGVMGLRGAALERGAALAGVTPDRARHDPVANIRAGAALLDAYAREAAIDRSRRGAWSAVVARYSGVEVSTARVAYLRAVEGLAPECPPDGGAGPDYSLATWRASPNFDARAADSTGVMHMLIIHTCETNYMSCWSWLVNAVSQVSAHYVVNEDGSEISQLVHERDRAWHIAASYDCSLNARHDCRLNGVQSNHFTVGIEHAGFASQDSLPATQLDASAALVCDVTRDRAIPRDWQHIVGHGQLQPANRTDPGPNWPWIPYLHRVQALCGEVVVDDSTAYNDPAVAAVAAPAGWVAADTTPEYYGGGYRWASTAPDAGGGGDAAFSFRLAAGTRTVEARWTSGTNRSPRAAYTVITATGDTLATVRVDQTTGGGRWHTLGTWTFPAGWNSVALSRQDERGTVVVADAVRARQ